MVKSTSAGDKLTTMCRSQINIDISTKEIKIMIYIMVLITTPCLLVLLIQPLSVVVGVSF